MNPMTLRIDRAACLLWIDEREVRLTPTEWGVFEYLFDHSAKNVPSDWINRNRGQSFARFNIRRIRAKMGDEWIKTRTNYGYRFIPQGDIIDVTPSDSKTAGDIN